MGSRSAERSKVTIGRSLHHAVRETWKRPKDALSHEYRRDRMAQWRREPVINRIGRLLAWTQAVDGLQGQAGCCHG